MAIRSDVAGIEKQYLLDMLAVEGCQILEIGCGDGRLTWKYAELAQAVVGIDVTPDTLAEGTRIRPERLAKTVSFLTASGVDLPFRSGSFNHVLFALSF